MLKEYSIVVFLALALNFAYGTTNLRLPKCNITSLGAYSALYASLIEILEQNACNISPDYPPNFDDIESIKFDFIVVGAGSAGAAIANRLSERSEWNVLLVEAGLNPPIESDIPAMLWSLVNTSYDWNYRTAPSPSACLGMNNGQCRWPRGKMLGGSSSMNAMLYVRGNPADYDRWAADGNEGWSYDDLYPLFKKLETYTLEGADEHDHGSHGNVNIERYKEKVLTAPYKIRKLITKAAKELGLKPIDINANQTVGVITVPGTLKDGKRNNTGRAYLTPLIGRKNLFLLKNATVSKILIDADEQAYGVEYYKDGVFKKVTCRKEVIVSAGALNSPQILMLSGIGPKEHLKEIGIPVIKNLKVGKNLQDHLIFSGFTLEIDNKFDEHPRDYDVTDQDVLYYYLTKNTDFASVGTLDTMMFIDTKNTSSGKPDLQIHTINFPANSTSLQEFLLFVMNVNESYVEGMMNANAKNHVLMLVTTLIHPKSRGEVFLNSKNPLEPPKLFSGYLEEQDDMEMVLKGVEFTSNMINTEVMKKFVKRLNFTLDVCDKEEFVSKKYWECYIRHLSSTIFHHAGSCKMGPASDAGAVVDAKLKVYGIKHLRVADASIMPYITSGNTNIPTIAIGEKAAEMITEEWAENVNHHQHRRHHHNHHDK